MAKNTIITRTDDVTGEDNATVESFSFPLPTANEDGTYSTVRHTLDASEATRERINGELARTYAAYVKAASKALRFATEHAKTSSRQSSSNGVDLTEVREWARNAGFTVAERGRVPAKVLEAFAAREV